jgi:hypothetical protein
MTFTHTITTVQPKPAAGPGALDGFEAVCSCGYTMGTSLSAAEATRLGAQHVDYMNGKGAR